MSSLKMTMIRHRGQTVALGRNVAVKLMLEQSGPKKKSSLLSMSQDSVGIVRLFHRPWSVKWL
jgi:hypothetical protein